MTVDIRIIGKRIKAFRKQKRMTQAELAERTDLSNVFISYIETGKKGASLAALMQIADALGISPVNLLLDDFPVKVPKAFRKIAAILADCDMAELERIYTMVSDYKTMIRAENR